jgi:5'-3' exonuclease
MENDDSPIAHFYPPVTTIRVDMNGKRNPWEGVTLIPFIDEAAMLAAIRDHCPDERLTADVRVGAGSVRCGLCWLCFFHKGERCL